MKKFFLILLAISGLGLILQSQKIQHLISSQSNDNLRFENIPTDVGGCVPLEKENSKFFVEPNVEGIPIKMLFSLYESRTLIASNNDLNFTHIDCLKSNCKEYPDEKTQYESPFFTGEGHSVEINLSLSTHDWIQKTKAMFCTKYMNNLIQSYGNGAAGILGLGIQRDSRDNFQALTPVFSVDFSNSNKSELCFWRNLNKAQSATPMARILTDNSWQIPSCQKIQLGNKIFNVLGLVKIVFDPNEEILSFPIYIFGQFMAAFNMSTVPIKCNISQIFRPNCAYQGKLSDLPLIILWIEGQNITITPWQYVQDPENYNSTKGTLTLNIRALHYKDKSPDNYVTSDYRNYIILGFPFMKDFHFIFTAKNNKNMNNTIELFEKSEYQKSRLFVELMIGILWITFVLGVVIIF